MCHANKEGQREMEEDGANRLVEEGGGGVEDAYNKLGEAVDDANKL